MARKPQHRAAPLPAAEPSKLGKGMSWFIIFIMIASTIGFAYVFSQDDNKPNTTEPPPLPDATPTTITYSADGIDANVVEVFSSMVLTASTTEAEITRIDSEIARVTGIRSVSSRYKTAGQDAASGLVYIANLVFAQGKTAKEIMGEISSSTALLTNLQGYSNGLVVLPNQVELYNSDLNLSKLHTFEDPLVQALLTVESRQGDALRVSLSLKISGEETSDVFTVETQNLNVGPASVALEKEFEISLLKPELRAVADMNYSKAPDQNTLRDALLAVSGVSSGVVKFTEPATTATIEFDGNIAEIKELINAVMLSVEGVTDVRFFASRSALNFDFNESADYKRLRSEIETSISETGAKITNFIDPRINLLADFNISTLEAVGSASSAFASVASSQGVPNLKVYQWAEFPAETLSDPDTNRAYTVDSNGFSGLVKQGAEAGDSVTLSIFFAGFRDEARQISAFETEND